MASQSIPEPFEIPPAEKYDIQIHTRPDVSLITVDNPLMHAGVQAMDAYYRSGKGIANIPNLRGKTFITKCFLRSEISGGIVNSFSMAAVNFENEAHQTVFGFRPDELLVGEAIFTLQALRSITRHEAGLLYVAERIRHFLKTKTDVIVSDPTFSPV